jgi:aspartyl-tRNA(Asn)/glutamyl-tRNA(Gln) amidotransferase subunit A
MTATVPTLVAAFQKKELSIEEHTKNVLVEAHELDARYNYFTVLCEKQALERARALDILVTQGRAADLKLLGVPISVKDAICVKGVETTASSRILKGYVPPFNATVVQRCLDQGGIVIGKTVQDEFGFGGFSVNVGLGYKIPKNPFDPERSTGGSSGGCAGFTQLTSFPLFLWVNQQGAVLLSQHPFVVL